MIEKSTLKKGQVVYALYPDGRIMKKNWKDCEMFNVFNRRNLIYLTEYEAKKARIKLMNGEIL